MVNSYPSRNKIQNRKYLGEDMYRYSIEDKVFKERVRKSVAKLVTEYNFGKYQQRTDYAFAIKEMIEDIHANASSPTFTYYEASDVPSYIHYKDMFVSSADDVANIISSNKDILNSIDDISKESAKLSQSLDTSFKNLEQSMVSVEENIVSLAESKNFKYSDNFSNPNFAVLEGFTPCATTNNVCRLCAVHRVPDNEYQVGIGEGSNGFPGNTHEVQIALDGYKYTGEDNPSLDFNTLKIPNSSKWAEFEMFNIEDDIFEETLGVGFKYNEDVYWVTEDNELRLKVVCTFENPAELNTLAISAIPKRVEISTSPIIDDITIYNTDGVTLKVASGLELREDVGITFQPEIVSKVIISITQRDFYTTTVSRVTYLPYEDAKLEASYVNTYRTHVFNETKNSYSTIRKDMDLFSITHIGLNHDIKTGKILYPTTYDDFNFISETTRKSNLYYYRSRFSQGEIYADIYEANRYVIGLKSIHFELCEYGKDSIYHSLPYISENPISSITLNANEFVPPSYFGIEDANGRKVFIEYYIRIDEEPDFIRVYPRENYHHGPSTIEINSALGERARVDGAIYIDRYYDVKRVQLRIIMRGHSEITFESPIVSKYFLEIGTR